MRQVTVAVTRRDGKIVASATGNLRESWDFVLGSLDKQFRDLGLMQEIAEQYETELTLTVTIPELKRL